MCERSSASQTAAFAFQRATISIDIALLQPRFFFSLLLFAFFTLTRRLERPPPSQQTRPSPSSSSLRVLRSSASVARTLWQPLQFSVSRCERMRILVCALMPPAVGSRRSFLASFAAACSTTLVASTRRRARALAYIASRAASAPTKRRRLLFIMGAAAAAASSDAQTRVAGQFNRQASFASSPSSSLTSRRPSRTQQRLAMLAVAAAVGVTPERRRLLAVC